MTPYMEDLMNYWMGEIPQPERQQQQQPQQDPEGYQGSNEPGQPRGYATDTNITPD